MLHACMRFAHVFFLGRGANKVHIVLQSRCVCEARVCGFVAVGYTEETGLREWMDGWFDGRGGEGRLGWGDGYVAH